MTLMFLPRKLLHRARFLFRPSSSLVSPSSRKTYTYVSWIAIVPFPTMVGTQEVREESCRIDQVTSLKFSVVHRYHPTTLPPSLRVDEIPRLIFQCIEDRWTIRALTGTFIELAMDRLICDETPIAADHLSCGVSSASVF